MKDSTAEKGRLTPEMVVDRVFLKAGLKPIEGEDNRYQFMRKGAGASLWKLFVTFYILQDAGIITEETCKEIKERCCAKLVEEFSTICPPTTGEYRFAGIKDGDGMPMLTIVEPDNVIDLEKHIAYCNGSVVMGTYRAMLSHLATGLRLSAYDENGAECGIETEMWTDGGVDMLAFIDLRDNRDARCSPYELARCFHARVDGFDVDEEIDVHRQGKAYRDNFSIAESVRDFEAYHDYMEGLADKLDEILSSAEQHHGLTRELCEGVFFSIGDLIRGLDTEE